MRHRQLGDKWRLSLALNTFGRLALSQGNDAEARALVEEGLMLSRELGDWFMNSTGLLSLQRQAFVRGDLASARAFGEEALALRQKMGDRYGTVMTITQMTFEQIVAETEQVTVSPPVPAPVEPNALTPRELEILRLLAGGLTDSQIAERLVISRLTVNTHLTAIYGKLGVNSRAAATRYALEHQLTR